MKILIIILAAIAALAGAWTIWSYQVSFGIDEGFDLGLDTPPDLIRQIQNPVFDDTVTFVKYSYETGGEYTLLEIELGPGGGNPTHFHERFTETFIAVDGTLGVEHKGEDHFLESGQRLTALPGEEHRFFNPGEERILFQVKIEPGSAGFEKALYLLYGLTRDGYADEDGRLKDLGHIALFLKLSDTRASGFLNLLNPLLKRAANRMEASGEADRLLQRYYYGYTGDSPVF
ncbi:MAG: cupin domain-containing protein [Opitutales bacterium]|nr:cupin domain-containing protein [Opitutales bacterium]